MKLLGVVIGKVKTDFYKRSSATLLTKSLDILTSMTDNPNFPTPVPDLASLEGNITTFQQALIASATGDRAAIATKNEARFSLITTLNSLAAYVNFTGNGNIPVLATSGFDLYKPAEPVVLTGPKKILVTPGPNSGELTVKASGAKGARSMVHQYTTDPALPDNGWTSFTTTATTYTFTGLTRAQEYWVRVAAVGSKGQVIYSDPISRIVQ